MNDTATETNASTTTDTATETTREMHIAYAINIEGGGAEQFADQLFVSAFSARETRAEGDHIVCHILFANIDAGLLLRLTQLSADGFAVRPQRIPASLLRDFQSISQHAPNAKIRTWSGIVYTRIFLAKLLPSVDRVIYLDADTMVRKSLADLWAVDLKGKMLGLNMGLVPEYGYNSGVMVMDLAKMRADEAMWPRLVEFMKREAATFYCPDQTVINRFFRDEITPIDRRYNYAPIQGALDRAGLTGSVVWHWYNGHSKPYVIAKDDVGISLEEFNRAYKLAAIAVRGLPAAKDNGNGKE